VPDQPDQPSLPSLAVGELIRCAERESQNLLATAGPADATSLARGWAEVLAGAQNILETIPHTAADTYPVEHHYLTIRVARMSAQAQRFGPVGLVGHAAMSGVAHTFDEAALTGTRERARLAPHEPGCPPGCGGRPRSDRRDIGEPGARHRT